MRLVLDTDVVVAAFRSPSGASRQLLIAALDERCTLLASTALWLEYEAVLTRPVHLDACRLTESEVRDALAALAEDVEPVTIRYRLRPSLLDADDELVLETAVNGQADFLVTFNRRDFAPAVRWFRPDVVLPAEAWRRIRG
jgi:putative PIN family toxin of toxin-antitoxin system